MAERVKKMSLSNESVKKLIQELLPEHVLLGKDVQEAVGKAGTMFVLHITDLALKIARKNNRNNLIGQDIMDALEEAGFGEFNKSLKKSLAMSVKTRSSDKFDDKEQENDEETEEGEED